MAARGNGIGPLIDDETTLGRLSRILADERARISVTTFEEEYSVKVCSWRGIYRGYGKTIAKALGEAFDELDNAKRKV